MAPEVLSGGEPVASGEGLREEGCPVAAGSDAENSDVDADDAEEPVQTDVVQGLQWLHDTDALAPLRGVSFRRRARR